MAIRYRRRKSSDQFAVPLNQHKGPPPPQEVLPWHWHPDRLGITYAPAAFRAQLHEIDTDLEAVYSPVHERWLIWCRNVKMRNHICPGWQLIFLWEDSNKDYLPLTELVFNNLYVASRQKWGRASKYYDDIRKRAAEAQQSQENSYQDERQARQREMAASWKISSAGQGNRSALHDQGELAPSKGTQNWMNETRRWRLPSELIQREKDEKEQREYGS